MQDVECSMLKSEKVRQYELKRTLLYKRLLNIGFYLINENLRQIEKLSLNQVQMTGESH